MSLTNAATSDSGHTHYRFGPGKIIPRSAYNPYPGAPDMHYAPRCTYCGNRNSKERCDSCGAPK